MVSQRDVCEGTVPRDKAWGSTAKCMRCTHSKQGKLNTSGKLLEERTQQSPAAIKHPTNLLKDLVHRLSVLDIPDWVVRQCDEVGCSALYWVLDGQQAQPQGGTP